MTTLPVHSSKGFHRLSGTSRRQFLRHLSVLCAAASTTALPSTPQAAIGDADLTARTSVQLARIKRTLDPKTMAGCRKVADKLAPRMPALLKGPDWQNQMIKAIVKELKAGDLLPVDRPPLDPACANEADRLRSEAQNIRPHANAVAASIAAAAAAVSTIPVTGPIIVAILVLIAAVLILIAQIIAKAREDESAAKEKPAGSKDAKADKEADDRLRLLKSDVVVEMESHPDCEFSTKKKH